RRCELAWRLYFEPLPNYLFSASISPHGGRLMMNSKCALVVLVAAASACSPAAPEAVGPTARPPGPSLGVPAPSTPVTAPAETPALAKSDAIPKSNLNADAERPLTVFVVDIGQGD